MTALDDTMHEEMIKELYARLDNYMASVIAENLTPQDAEEFIKINEAKKDRSEIEKFLKDKVPNVNDVFAKAFMDFRDLYLGGVTIARNKPSNTNPPADTTTAN